MTYVFVDDRLVARALEVCRDEENHLGTRYETQSVGLASLYGERRQQTSYRHLNIATRSRGFKSKIQLMCAQLGNKDEPCGYFSPIL